MKKFIVSVAAFVALSAQALSAQDFQFGGALLNQDIIVANDLARLSATNAFGSSRVMGMGGAFTSLGADVSSVSINPAGLGMFQSGQFSVTPMLSIANASTGNTSPWESNTKTSFAVPNVGLAINLFESSHSPLISLTMGVQWSRVSDYNSNISYSSESRYDASRPDVLTATIADIFAQQLAQADLYPNGKGELGYKNNPYLWPAILGYNGYMVSPVADGWTPDGIGRNASVLSSTNIAQRGGLDEFNLSIGGNVLNKLYFGASFGMQTLDYSKQTTYQEEYGYFNNSEGLAEHQNGSTLPSQLTYANLLQEVYMQGSGFNFKVGVVARPTDNLRIGVAYHSPIFFNVNRSYAASLESEMVANEDIAGTNINAGDLEGFYNETPWQIDDMSNSWDYRTPSKLLAGASYAFAQRAIISFDYERNWTSTIRVSGTPYGVDFRPADYKEQIKSSFKATNTYRAGLEYKVLPALALRAGGGYTSSMVRNEQLSFDSMLPTQSYYFTAGAGFALTRTATLDIAYQNLHQCSNDYALYFSQLSDGSGFVTDSGLYNTSLVNHYISMTLGFRF